MERSTVGRSGKLRGGAAVVVSAAAVVLGSGCGVFEGQSSQETVVIAADLELTGSAHTLGTVYRDALQLRVDQVNAQGLLGDRRLELIIRDNRSDPAISRDRKSTRLNSSHVKISYAVF